MLKYGYSNFQLEILEYSTKNKVLIKEQYYLDLLKSEYNILTTAGSSLGYRHSPETIAKFKARKHSPETKAKIREKTQTAERIEQLKRIHADPEYQRKRLEQLKRLNLSPEHKVSGVLRLMPSECFARTTLEKCSVKCQKSRSIRYFNENYDCLQFYQRSSQISRDKSE